MLMFLIVTLPPKACLLSISVDFSEENFKITLSGKLPQFGSDFMNKIMPTQPSHTLKDECDNHTMIEEMDS